MRKLQGQVDVRAIRSELGLTQVQLARMLDVHLRTVVRWELGQVSPRAAVLRKLETLVNRSKIPVERYQQRDDLRVGICGEFADTSLPLLAAVRSGFLANMDRFVTLVPIPWDDRCLDALENSLVDLVLYNEHCGQNYLRRTGALQMASDGFESGRHYVALSIPSSFTSGSSTFDLLHTLWDQRTVKLVPRADLRQAMRHLRRGSIQQGSKLGQLAEKSTDQTWLTVSASQGVSHFLKPLDEWQDRPVAFIGGQDQRALIELATGALPSNRTVWIIDDAWEAVGESLSRELRSNRLIASNWLAATYAPHILEAIESARNLMQADTSGQMVARSGLLSWQHLYGSDISPLDGVAHEASISLLRRTKELSMELGRWIQ